MAYIAGIVDDYELRLLKKRGMVPDAHPEELLRFDNIEDPAPGYSFVVFWVDGDVAEVLLGCRRADFDDDEEFKK